MLDQQPTNHPRPATKGLAKEGKATLHKSEEALHDMVALSGALETEDLDIAIRGELLSSRVELLVLAGHLANPGAAHSTP